MNCREFEKHLSDMFDRKPGPLADEMAGHMETCQRCKQLFESWQHTVGALTPSARIAPSDELKKRIMHGSENQGVYPITVEKFVGLPLKNGLVAAAAVFLAIISITIFYAVGEKKSPNDPQQFLGLVKQAMAAQEEFVYSDGTSYLVVEHILPAVKNPNTARSRWFPMQSLRPDGTLQHNRVMTGGRSNQPYSVKEELWVDYEHNRFAHVISFDDMVIFANSCDGTNFYTMTVEEENYFITTPAAPEFSLPEKLPQMYGMLAEWDSLLNTDFLERNHRMSLTGKQTLESGEQVRILEIQGLPGPDGAVRYRHLRKIRISDNTLAETESILDDETSIINRYQIPVKTTPRPGLWRFDGLNTVPGPVMELYGLSLETDVIRNEITRREAVELYETDLCALEPYPAWTGSETITFSRRFRTMEGSVSIVYKADPGGRHVVLYQDTYLGKLAYNLNIYETLYESPAGFKIYSMGERAEWFANIALTASSGVHRDQPSEDRVAYMVETPEGGWCQLAINGHLTDTELFALMDQFIMLPQRYDRLSEKPLS